MSNVLQVSDAGHVRTLRLNRPEKKNALSDELAWGIIAAVEEAAIDDNVWVIGITGTKDAFCSGLDLTPTRDGQDPDLTRPPGSAKARPRCRRRTLCSMT